jgi:formate hydrogenlyase subunit 6/NADH:ubiquinone oxidoreductase subunit I
MKLPCLLQFRILKLAIKSLLTAPFTSKFPAQPYEPVKQFKGRPRYDEDECIGCGACAEVCPADCIDMVDDTDSNPPVRRLVQHLDQCICCGQCEKHCTSEKGIRLTNEYDFVGFCREDFEEKVEKDLLLCEECGCIIAPIDQIKWLVNRLGPLAFTNPTLMLVSQRELAVVDDTVVGDADRAVRSDRISIQCPKCRRKSALAV